MISNNYSKAIPVWILLAVLVTFSIDSKSEELPTGADRPWLLPRETGTPGDKYLEAIDQYTNIDVGGDLNLSIPLFKLPGKIPVPLNLTYNSQITVDQGSGPVGLGWNLASWSVRRITIHGDDVMTRTGHYNGSENNRYMVNDAFRVSVPGRSLLFLNMGTMTEPRYVPQTFTNDSLYCYAVDTADGGNTFAWQSQHYFVMVDANGTRYVFKQPLKRLSIKAPFDDFFSSLASTTEEKAEWLLTAILSHDYVDGTGDPLNPLDSSDPRYDNQGAWVSFVHCDTAWNEFTKTRLELGAYSWGIGNPGTHTDYQEIAYLKKIISPTAIAQFHLKPPNLCNTIRFQRTGSVPGGRVKDMIVGQISVHEYSGNGTEPTGPELFGVTFNYENLNHTADDTLGLKERYHEFVTSLPDGSQDLDANGEPTLRSVVIGANIAYPRYNRFAPAWQLTNDYLGRREYKFDYSWELDTESNHFTQCDSVFYDYNDQSSYYRFGILAHAAWADSSACVNCINDHTCMDTLSECYFGSRDHFGYHIDVPWAWSLTSLTTPEGLEIDYEYESDVCLIDGHEYLGGGCRVKSITINGNCDDGYPEYCDYIGSQTTYLTYGNADDGIGYPTSLPDTYWSLLIGQTSCPEPAPDPTGWHSQFESTLGGHVSHEVQYPRIAWHLPDNHGTIERYYRTTDVNLGSERHRMSMGPFELNENSGFYFTSYITVWHDRSPTLGLLYKTQWKDSTGTEVKYEEFDYSFPVMDAALFVADSFPLDNSSPFPLGDTVAASYFVQLNSIVHRLDGVEWTESIEYDTLKRVSERHVHAHDKDRYAHYSYASQTNAHMRSRHYLSAIGSEMDYEVTDSTVRLVGKRIKSYRSDFQSQNNSGTNSIWYLSTDSTWLDVDRNYVESPGDDFLVSRVLDYDLYGSPILVEGLDGTFTGYVSDGAGNVTSFANVEEGGFAVFNAEADIEQSACDVTWGTDGRLDSLTSFTGRRCALIPGHSHTSYGPTVQFDPVLEGLYVAEAWMKSDAAGPSFLGITSSDSLDVITDQSEVAYTQVGDWQRIVCTLSVVIPNHLTVYTKSTNDDCYVDDLRVYRAGAHVSATVLDPMGRVTCDSDANNMPTRTYYHDDGMQMATADYRRSPLAGVEYHWHHDSFIYGWPEARYREAGPNQKYSIQSRTFGVVEDFRNNPVPGWIKQGSGPIEYDIENQRLLCEYETPMDEYIDLWVPVDQFSDGILAFDVYWHRDEGLKETKNVHADYWAPDPTYTNVWFGFEDSSGAGYAAAVSVANGLSLLEYNLSDYSDYTLIDTVYYERHWTGYEPDAKHRLMLAKQGDNLYVFNNGDCLHHTVDTSHSSFDYLRLRLKGSSLISEGQEEFWIDNLVFYGTPIVKTEFVDAFGLVGQTQVYDGEHILVSGTRHSLDMLETAVFKPIAVGLHSEYESNDGLGNHYNCIPTDDHCIPFDLIRCYLDRDSIASWSPGNDISAASALFSYFDTTVGAPDCYDETDFVPYLQTDYENSPLRRTISQLSPGSYRAHPVATKFGASEDDLGYIDDTEYGVGDLSKIKVTNENGTVDVVYWDKFGHRVLTVADSIVGGINAVTTFYPDHLGNDTLVVQPTGTELKYQYNNLGWLLNTESSDKEIEYSFYDQMGRLRLIATPLELSLHGYRYNKYDGLGRVVEQGLMPDVGSFDRVTAFNPDKPDAANRRIIAEYEYDQGPNAVGRLTKWTRYHSPGNLSDSASWGAFEYDEYGRAVHFEQFVYGVDSLVPRSYDAAYDLQGNVTRITYSDGTYVDYEYDPAGQVRRVTDGDGFLSVEYEYWPDGSVKTKKLGDVGAGPIQSVDFAYNARGWLESINDGSIQGNDLYSLELTYDEGGYPGRDFGTPIFDTSYYNGNIASYTLAFPSAQQVTQRYAYDALDRLAGEHLDGRSGTDSKLHYRYDANGNIDSIWVPYLLPPLNTQYAYNYDYYPGTNRVSSIQNIAPDSQSLTYNSHGGVTAYTHLGLTMDYNLWQELSHQSRSGIHEVNPDNLWFYYNAEGQRIAKNYQYYSPADCDTIGTGHDTTIIVDKTILKNDKFSPTKDIFGTRGVTGGGGGEQSICTTLVSVTTGYYYFLGNMMADYTGPDTADLKAKYVYVNGDRVARFETDSTDVMYYLKDHLGSTVGIASYTGQLRDVYRYRPFGAPWYDAVQTGDMFNYTGQLKDQELNHDLYYYGARYYDPILKIFTQVDPLDSKYPGWSPYVYTLDNPLKLTDPDGQGPIAVAMKVGRKLLAKRLVKAARQRAVRQAWACERELLRRGLKTTMTLSPAEQSELLKKGKVSGWIGHHINSVSGNDLASAADPNNILFVKGRAAHFAEHSFNWLTKTSGPLIDRLSKLSGPALLAFFMAYDDKLQELLGDCAVCSGDDSWHSLFNPWNSIAENIALIYGYAAADQAKAEDEDDDNEDDDMIDAYDPENGSPPNR